MVALHVAAFVSVLVTAAAAFADDPKELIDLRRDYERAPQTEAARDDFITRLVRMRERLVQAKNQSWQAVDAEVIRHPAPPHSAGLSERLVGEWRSPRHDYAYRRDGTWSMLPEEPDTTHGTWRIKGSQFFEGTSQYTIILLSDHDFVFTDGAVTFYEKRIGK
jgi:hypothetical protein